MPSVLPPKACKPAMIILWVVVLVVRLSGRMAIAALQASPTHHPDSGRALLIGYRLALRAPLPLCAIRSPSVPTAPHLCPPLPLCARHKTPTWWQGESRAAGRSLASVIGRWLTSGRARELPATLQPPAPMRGERSSLFYSATQAERGFEPYSGSEVITCPPLPATLTPSGIN